MRIAAFCAPAGHYRPLMQALINGMQSAGDEVFPAVNARSVPPCDVYLCWGWRRGKDFRRVNPKTPILVMERGYVGDRFHWTSLGWNGLNGRAIFPKPRETDCVARYVKEFGQLTPWRVAQGLGVGRSGYALILGQVQGDQACIDVNLAYQYRGWAQVLQRSGWKVRYRPHPKALRQNSGLPSRCWVQGTLAEDLAGAAFTVSWNSNASVDSVLAGVPSVTLDKGAMAWAVTSHDINNPVTMPARTEWAAQLAWCQWQPAELSDGTAWRAVREVIP